ncbi:hypothetical protein [Myceligenerans xiligouense]|uniref:Uncharacterized protein n=1 Tax=Myceligenerans xiligouense TaxID=253184 RepID=A0A3N4Z8N5_9MICO|nr:hypothetical protein [Myceligenerans xiligouense]RPF21722.1 hypothetical protein EDD34_2357 [Myceligenerans xiligouense]
MPEAPRSAVERSATAGPAQPDETTGQAATAPVLTMLADDGAACVDGVCALPDPARR